MTIKSYSYEAEALVKEYLLAESFVPYISVLGGIAMCKMAYDITHWFSSQYIDGYRSLTKVQRIEWNNRGMSSAHAIYITVMSLFLVFYSDLFSDDAPGGPTVFRSSPLSIFTLGVSVGYFITDLAMIFWSYPSLGGMEYVSHHLLSVFAISYAILSGEGQLYTFLCLISETTTPGVNLRWFLDVTGMKRTKTYIVNGVVMFFSWVVARLLLFMFLFYHLYCHYEQVKQMDSFAYVIVFSVPSVLAVMNVVWFGKILRGLRRTLTKSQ
ncbi:unnamed protein product [Spirodela intermedia]|uniref:TLC domain-containing protein n=1 Tax=Spirodela intermedia TaxID=51605 RepID=A0A7I8KA74_SPIIN|nr:unnamed protein product [Spirodela intermedia]